MKIMIKIMAVVFLSGLSWLTNATQSEETDSNSCRTTSKDWKDMQIMFPNLSLGEVLVQINQSQANISTILGGAAGTPIGKAAAIQILIAVQLLPTIQLPLPVNYPAYPYVPLDITSDLTQVISQINPGAGTLGAAVATEVTFISVVSLPPTILVPIPVSSGIIHTDLIQLRDRINPGALTLGAAVATEVALIGVVSLPATVPLPIPYPYVSSGVIHTDLAKAIGQIDTTGGVNLGQAITNGVNKIDISSTHTPTPVIPNPLFVPPFIFGPVPPNRVSSGIIKDDLDTFNSMLDAAPSLTVGLTYQALMDRLAVFFRDGGAPNVIAAGTTLPPTLDGVLTALGI